jgi:hypothetical protein
VRVTVRHAVAGLVDEVAAGLGGHPGRPVDPGVDDGDSYASSGCELLRLGQPQIITGPWAVREVRVRERCRRSTDPALLHRLVGACFIRRDSCRIDDRRLDGSDRRCGQQHQEQCGNQRTKSAHARSPPTDLDQRTVCWHPDSKLADHKGAAEKVSSRLRVEGTRQC